MKLKIEYKKIDDLIPYVNNSRTHSPMQVQQIASSIKEFGWTNPLLLDGDNGIIAGHGRLKAAQMLGEKEVPTIQLDGLTEMQKKAYIIADNKLALNAGWDNELLGIEIMDLKEFGFNIDLLGFNEDELKEFEFENDEEIKDENSVINESKNLLMIECVDERELELIFEEMQTRGFQCKILS
jgi:ParB-like chromosome segregation protein Spo0J